MKKVGTLIVFSLLMAAVTTAHTEIKEDFYSLTPFVGDYFFEVNHSYEGED